VLPPLFHKSNQAMKNRIARSITPQRVRASDSNIEVSARVFRSGFAAAGPKPWGRGRSIPLPPEPSGHAVELVPPASRSSIAETLVRSRWGRALLHCLALLRGRRNLRWHLAGIIRELWNRH